LFVRLLLFATVLLFPLSAFADSKLENCIQFKDEIESILISENVSTEYFYLAVCESGCKIKESHKGARGLFQIMPRTFAIYKDETCTDIDDIRCNTIAAARYIKHLQDRFKDLPTIIKAYNRGGTNLIRKGSTSEADNLSMCVTKYIRSQNNG
jgi:hypothetical protein